MVLLPPPICITLLPCKKTWKQAKRISSRRGDVYLLIKNTCSAKMKSMCLALDEQIAIEHMKSDFKVECGVQVWIYIGYLLQLVYTMP